MNKIINTLLNFQIKLFLLTLKLIVHTLNKESKTMKVTSTVGNLTFSITAVQNKEEIFTSNFELNDCDSTIELSPEELNFELNALETRVTSGLNFLENIFNKSFDNSKRRYSK